MRKYYNLLLAEGMKFCCELKRYWFNTVLDLIVVYMIFLAMFFGIKFFAGPSLNGDDLDALIIGYIMWMFATSAFQSLSQSISEEMQRGTLEQLYLCPFGIEKSFVVRIFLNFFFIFIFNALILILTMVTTGRWPNIDILKITPVLLIALPALWGLGIIVGGITMIFKKVTSLQSVITFGLVGIVSVPAYPLSIFSFLPFSAGSSTVQLIVRKGQAFPLSWYFFITGISVVYL